MLQPGQLLGSLVSRNIPPDADVASEPAGVFEDRLAAERQPDHPAVVREALDLEIPEGLVAFELGAVPVPVRLRKVERRLVPTPGSKIGCQIYAGLLVLPARHESEAELGVLLPVPVARKLAEPAEAELARATRIVRLARIGQAGFFASASLSFFCSFVRSRAAGRYDRPAPLARNLLERYQVVQR